MKAVRSPITRSLIIGLACLMLASAPVQAQEITADRFLVNEGSGEAVFSGNVVIKQPDLTVWAEQVVVHYGDDGPSDLRDFEAIGGVEIEQPEQTASGDRAFYNPTTKVLTLSGNVVVTNSSGTVRGPELIVDIDGGTSEFTSSTGTGRIVGIFVPQE